MGYIFSAIIFVFICALAVRIGVDYSKNAEVNRNILKELKEIKEYIKDKESGGI